MIFSIYDRKLTEEENHHPLRIFLKDYYGINTEKIPLIGSVDKHVNIVDDGGKKFLTFQIRLLIDHLTDDEQSRFLKHMKTLVMRQSIHGDSPWKLEDPIIDGVSIS